jgi:hypothetical protein
MTYTPKRTETMPIPVEPAVISINLKNSISATDIPIYVPWKHCQLSYVYSVVTTAIDATGDLVMKVELNAATGSRMYNMTVAASAAVGDIDEAAVSSQAACENLSSDNAARDVVNIEIDGSSTGTGAIQLFLYFEPWGGE